MDLTKAIDRNRDALAAIILALGAMLRAGVIGDGRITKLLRKAVLRILTPAESAVRRLIVIAARKFTGPGFFTGWDQAWPRKREKREDAETRLTFPLFDPPKRAPEKPEKPASGAVPRIRSFGDPNLVPPGLVNAANPAAPPPPVDPTVDARRLYWRIDAARKALADIPGQARRLARLRALRARAKKPARPPLRNGPAPGHRKKPAHEIDDVLAECQYFAEEALADTS